MTNCEKTEQFVCISCVDDLRYSFVSHLSKALRLKGINDVVIDVDSDDLLSKESLAKVEKARVSVMVLPGDNNPTKVLLDKFVKVLAFQRNHDQVVVVPVLYGDSPLQEEWRSALDLRGLSLIHQSRMECSDSKLVEEILRDVYEKLFYKGRIGIYPKVLEIEKMVSKQPLGIWSLGIWGMPGIGKTALAKAVFDQMSGDFDACCFIEDYDKVIHEKGLYRLLEENFLKANPGADGTTTKLSLLRNRLNNKRVLVVLDDVHNPLVAEPFLGGFDWFGSKSLIIIISRDKQVLRLCRVNQIYEVQGLNEKEACQLFSSCASINHMAEQNLHELSMKVIKYANGHPLALNIYGRELKRKRKLSEMETAFLKLKLRPPFKIVDAFKSSYDTLSDSEKNIFLDIACFFQGENVDYVMQLLEGCGFFPHVGINVLVEKCLVTISDNCVRMHNLIQDVGREIINGETVQIERRSRLWEPWSIKYLLANNEHRVNGEPKTTFKRAQGTEEIKGMFLDTSNLSFDVKPTAFDNMLNLRLLKIYCSNPGIHPVINFPYGSLHFLSNELRLLHWENYPAKDLPQSFDPRNLVEINMPYSQLETLWGGTKNLEMLRTIRLCHSQKLKNIGDLRKVQNIEVIDLQGCIRLQSFPAAGKLLHLRVVNLSGCKEIKSFPEIPPNIETLNLQGTGIRELLIVKPNGGDLVSLSELKGLSNALKLEHLISLEKSSSCNQYLGKLICLELKDCSHLRSLPNMVNLEFLKVLDLSGCSELKTIQGFPQNLKELYLAGTAVKKVPQLPQSLELLNAHGCVSLKSVCLDSEMLPMHYTFSNCYNLSPQGVNEFLVKALDNVKHMPRERQQGLNKPLAFSFCAPSHVTQNSTLDLQPGSSVMTRLIPSWKNTLVGFAMLVEVAFSEDYCDPTGFGISCVCRWKNKEGRSQIIERNLHCLAPGEAVQKHHMFVFCDVKMRPSTDEGNNPDIWADLVVFEFFPVNRQKKRLDDSCTVTRCGVHVITAATGNISRTNTSPVLALDPMGFSHKDVEEILSVYDDLPEINKALFLYIASLFNDEDVDLVAPLISSIDSDVSSGLKVLANMSLIRVSSNGEIVMHYLVREIGKEILHIQSMLLGSSKHLTQDFEKVSMASSLSCNWKYDVFLSYCEQDVCKNILSHFLVALESKLITTFKDSAIKESRISVVLFTKNYASSGWLLNELVEIMMCRNNLRQEVIPIFFDVDPSDVRRQTGEFGRLFEQTCNNETGVEKQQWCHALTEITNIAGFVSGNWENNADMMDTVANVVSNKLNTITSRDFGDFVGIEDHLSNMNILLSLEVEEVRCVGICGPSGIGKSTIARALFSRFAHQFRCSILVDRDFIDKTVENCRRVNLDEYGIKLQLQTYFLSEILGQEYLKVHHLGIVGKWLKDQKVFIILDDAVGQVLLNALAQEIQWFGSGSRIIVVTNDRKLLLSQGIAHIYEVKFPSEKQALQMFCRYAFGQNSPPDGFVELSSEAVRIAGNLPLGLRVLGSSLRGIDKTKWMDVLPQTKNSLNGEIEKILKQSYDCLNVRDKTIFLHIACFFNNDTVEHVTELSVDSHWDVSNGLTSLAEKCLLHISEHGVIEMHDLLQALGREIVRKESIDNPGKRRFLDSTDLCDVLEDCTGTASVLGILFDFSEINELFISKRVFNRMINLQFLRFYSNLEKKEGRVYLPDGLDNLSSKLRLLHWEAFPLRSLPPNFCPKKLVELTMEASRLEKLWDEVQPLGRLKRMSLRGSLNLKEIPNLLKAINLERLVLSSCMSLIELPSSVNNLHKLKDLDMEGCIKLEVLPTGINLESLYFLNLNGCSRLKSFPEISRNISDLYLDETAIEEVPSSIENISGLSYLSMSGCNNLRKISSNISKLKHLEDLDFSYCGALTEDSWQNHPEEICTSIMRLDMSGNSFERLPDTWTSIQPKDLLFNNCRNLVSLPELPASLSMLMANNCESLESVCGSFNNPQTALQFMNCFKLNHHARELILQSDCAYAILPGEEVPENFTHQAHGSFLTISFPQSSISKRFPSFKACIVVESRFGWFYFGVIWSFKGGKDKKFFSCLTDTTSTSNHLITFGCEFSPDEVSDVLFEFFCLGHKNEMIKIKECGIQLLEVSPFAEDSGKRSEIEYGNDSGLTNVEDTASSKRRRIK